jgi:competence protein ComGC
MLILESLYIKIISLKFQVFFRNLRKNQKQFSSENQKGLLKVFLKKFKLKTLEKNSNQNERHLELGN